MICELLRAVLGFGAHHLYTLIYEPDFKTWIKFAIRKQVSYSSGRCVQVTRLVNVRVEAILTIREYDSCLVWLLLVDRGNDSHEMSLCRCVLLNHSLKERSLSLLEFSLIAKNDMVNEI